MTARILSKCSYTFVDYHVAGNKLTTDIKGTVSVSSYVELTHYSLVYTVSTLLN